MYSNTNWKVSLSSQPSISRQLIVGCDYLVSFVQTRKNVSDTGNPTSAFQRHSARSPYSRPDEAVFQIIDKRGSTLKSFQIPGKFSGLSVNVAESTLKRICEELVAYELHKGVVTAQNVKTNTGLGTFTVNNTEITAVNFSSNGKSAVVGCANGNLHIIQMI